MIRRARLRLLRVGCVLSASLVSVAAAAAPLDWDTLRDPSLSTADRALVRAIHARASRDLIQEIVPLATGFLALRAALLLELAGGEALLPGHPEVAFFLGDACIVADHARDSQGVRVLRDALHAEPDSPLAARAWADIAVASNRLSDFASARAAASESLRLEWDREGRGRLLLARAAAEVATGELALAARDYQVAQATAVDAEILALAKWGLGSTLARSGNLPEAGRLAREAAAVHFSDSQGNTITVLELPAVRLTPAYDVFYYRALSAMGQAEAESESDPAAAASELESARSSWQRYLILARSAKDVFVENAEQLLRACERRASSGGAPRRRAAGGPRARQ